ncbi:MAG: general secretion pathway protein GspB, partial [Gammaproteobacteria bacterium]
PEPQIAAPAAVVSGAAAPLQAPAQAPGQAPGQAPVTDAAPWPNVRTIERIALTELPPAARTRLPGIVISSHVYSEDPESRTIIANGVTLREGSVLAGLPLKEIGPDGIVVEFESWLVEIPVFADW